MSQEIKYIHGELEKAVERIQDMGDYSKEVDASRKAGEILNKALDSMEKTVYQETKELIDEKETESLDSSFDNKEFTLG